MFKLKTTGISDKIILGLILYSASLAPLAVEPLTESDMDKVSGDVGLNLTNILNVAGAPAAGLKNDLVEERFNEGESIEPQAKTEIRNLEEKISDLQDIPPSTSEEINIFEAALESSIQVERKADTTFTTSSEAQYREEKFSHSIKVLSNGNIEGFRDVTIDTLKIENLRGDRYNDLERNAGSIYISNMQTEVQTKMSTRD